MKTHWLYGIGKNKLVKFEVEIDVETDCVKCCHNKVCSRDMSKRCANYKFGTSSESLTYCNSCSHKFTRFDKEPIPCFICNEFMEKEKK